MRTRIAYGLVIVLWVASLGAAQGPTSSGSSRTRITTERQVVVSKKAVPYQVGTASWYGIDFNGRVTASGEPFNMYDLTAAHPTLPLGTWVRVTNLHNGRTVLVRINDRGPTVPGRIIDVSYGTARALHFKAQGVQRVRLDVVHPQLVAVLRPVAY